MIEDARLRVGGSPRSREDALRRLVVVHYPYFGGPQNQALRLNGPLEARGVRSVVVLPREPGNAADRLRRAGVEVIEIPLARLRMSADPRVQTTYPVRFARDIRRLREVFRTHRPNIVEIAGLTNTQGAIAAHRERVPVVWQVLDTRTPAVLRRPLMAAVDRWADAVMSTGDSVLRAHAGYGAVVDRAVSFFPPVDTHTFRPDYEGSTRARRALDLDGGRPVVGCVANLTPQKGLENFIAAARAIRGAGRVVDFVILGAAMETQQKYEVALRDAARGFARIVDPADRVHELIRALDVFVLSSVPRSEGIPTTALEAMASGVPVVATDVGGVSEAVVDGQTGFVVAPLDTGALVARILRLLDDPDERRALGNASRERAVQLFDVSACADRHLEAYELALARGARLTK